MAVFGLKYWAEMRSKYQGIAWKCEIAQRGYTGPSEQMTFSGVSPIKITWERRGDDFYTPVKASEASININCTHNFHYLSLFTSDPREYRMSLYRNGSLFWRGFIVDDLSGTGTSKKITFGARNKAKLSAAQLALVTDKGWVLE